VDEKSVKHWQTWVVVGLTAMIICIIDLIIPLGIAGAMPYVIVALIALWLPRRRYVIAVAIGCTFLTLLGGWLSPSTGEAWEVAINRGLAVFAIWITVILFYRYRFSIESKVSSAFEYLLSVSSLPIKGFSIALLLAAVAFIGLGTQAWFSFQASEEYRAYDIRIYQLRGDIVFLDEALTTSARMFTETGENHWLERYKNLMQRLDTALKEAIQLTATLNICDGVALIHTANDKLIAMEQGAIEKMRNGQTGEAKALLSSEMYSQQKANYASGIEQVVVALKMHMNRVHEAQQVRTHGILSAVGVTLLVMFCAWVYTLVTLRRQLAQRKQAEVKMLQSQRCFREQFTELELLYSTTPVGLCLIDIDLRYVRINQEMAVIDAVPITEHVGRHIWEVMPDIADKVESFCRQVIATGQPIIGQKMSGPAPTQPNDQRDWLVGYHPLKDDAGCVNGISLVVKDITKQNRDEQALRNRVEFESLVARLSTKFIALKPMEIDDGINEALKAITRFSRVDRSYIFQFSSDRKSISNSHEWCAEGITAHKDDIQELATDTFPWIMPQHLKGQWVHIPSVADLPVEAAAEKEEFQRQAIKSLVCVPLTIGGEVKGFVGFDSVLSEKVWSNETISLLRIVGEMFANAIARQQADESLCGAHQNLENRVGERTKELASANERLKQEIADRQRIEEALRASEKQFRKIFDHSNDAIFVIDPACEGIVDANQAACSMLGYSREQLLSMMMSDIHPNDISEIKAVAKSVLSKGSGRIEECQCRTSNGTDVDCELSASVLNVGSRPLMLSLVRNISDRKRAEMILHTVVEGTSSVIGSDFLESLVRNLAQSLQVRYVFVVEHEHCQPVKALHVLASWLGDKHGERFTYDIVDTPCQETVNLATVFYPTDVKKQFPKDTFLVEYGVESYCAIQLLGADGAVFGHLIVMDNKPMQQNLLEIPMMRIFAARAAVELERERAELALRDNESRFRALYEDNPSMYFTLDAQGIVKSVNRFGADQLGYTPQELVGHPVLDIVYDADRDIVRSHLAKCLQHPGDLYRWEFRKVRKDGSILWVREAGRSVPGKDSRSPVVLIVCEEITNQKHAEDLMHLQTQVLESVAKDAELSDTLNAMCHYVERFVSPATCLVMLLGQDGCLQMVAGSSISNACGTALDGLAPSALGASCGTAAYSGQAVYIDDTLADPRWADFRGIAEQFDIRACWSIPIFVDGKTVVGTFAISRATKGYPNAFQKQILEAASHVAGIAIGHHRAQEQVQKHQEELAHVTRLSTVGEMASGLAHEINQPLAAISNYVQVCAGELRSGQWDREELVGTMEKASFQCHRASEIIRRLRDFVSKRVTRRSKMNINHVIQEAMDLVQSDPRSSRVGIELDLNEKLQSVNVDGIQIEQVIINLAKNSLDAMAENTGHERRLKICSALSNSQAIRVSLSDTGSGLPKGQSGKVFEPFFTTKTDGMGMGLSISRTIIEAHGGRMGVSVNSDRGVTFQFTLPTNEEHNDEK